LIARNNINFHRAANGIFGKIGIFASDWGGRQSVTKSKYQYCCIILNEACKISNASIKCVDFAVNIFFTNTNIVNVVKINLMSNSQVN